MAKEGDEDARADTRSAGRLTRRDFLKVGGGAAVGVYVDIDGRLFPAFYGIERQDVVDSLGVPSYRYCGFERALPVSEIGAGAHEVSVVILTADREGYYRSDQKGTLEVG